MLGGLVLDSIGAGLRCGLCALAPDHQSSRRDGPGWALEVCPAALFSALSWVLAGESKELWGWLTSSWVPAKPPGACDGRGIHFDPRVSSPGTASGSRAEGNWDIRPRSPRIYFLFLCPSSSLPCPCLSFPQASLNQFKGSGHLEVSY